MAEAARNTLSPDLLIATMTFLYPCSFLAHFSCLRARYRQRWSGGETLVIGVR